MQAGREWEARNRCGINIGQAEERVATHEMPAALHAELPIALFRLLETTDQVDTLRDLHIPRLPQGEGVDRPRRPGTARAAVAIAHRFGRTANLNFDRPAKTGSGMGICHVICPDAATERSGVDLD